MCFMLITWGRIQNNDSSIVIIKQSWLFYTVCHRTFLIYNESCWNYLNVGNSVELLSKHQHLSCNSHSVLRSLRVGIMYYVLLCVYHFVQGKPLETMTIVNSDSGLDITSEIVSIRDEEKRIPHEVWKNNSFHSQLYKQSENQYYQAEHI